MMEKGFKVREDLNIAVRRTLRILMAFLLCLTLGTATVSISGDFYNSDYSTSITEIEENANSAGYAILTPSGGIDGFPYSILAAGTACANQVESPVKFKASVSASGKGKSVQSDAMFVEDAEIAPVLLTKWNYKAALGDTASQNGEEICTLDEFLNMASIPGWSTYPTSAHLDPSASAGIVSRAFDENGNLFDKKYIPPWPKFDYPLTIGVIKTEGIHFENIMEMHAKW